MNKTFPKVIRNREIGGGFKIKYSDKVKSDETYATRKGAQAMIDGKFGSCGGFR